MTGDQKTLDQIGELVEDLAFEIARQLDWVDLIRRDLPPLTPDQERVLRDMADAFAAGQLLDRELDGDPLGTKDRQFVRDVAVRLSDRYGEGVEADAARFLDAWTQRLN